MGGGQVPTTCTCGDCPRCRKRVTIREWKRRNREKANVSRRAWAERNPDKVAKSVRAWQEAYPDKRRAHDALNNAIKRGRLQRQSCEVCGGRAQAHHEDYSRPLEVRWLCSVHHGEVHRKAAA